MPDLKSIEGGGVPAQEENWHELADEPVPVPGPFHLPGWVTAKSPDEPVEKYINHPLNLPRSPGLARALRGLTGILGSLEYALIDVLIGLVSFVKERMPSEPPGASGA